METWARDAFRYTPLFCEENIWWLARGLIEQGIDTGALDVMFFINPSDSVLLFEQRGAAPGSPVAWDYHVVLQARLPDQTVIFDFDSRLSFPQPAKSYFAMTFGNQKTLPENLRTWVRTTPAADYLAHFYSDRSHMIGQIPMSAFPDYSIIQPSPGITRIPLSDYRDMKQSAGNATTPQPVAEID